MLSAGAAREVATQLALMMKDHKAAAAALRVEAQGLLAHTALCDDEVCPLNRIEELLDQVNLQQCAETLAFADVPPYPCEVPDGYGGVYVCAQPVSIGVLQRLVKDLKQRLVDGSAVLGTRHRHLVEVLEPGGAVETRLLGDVVE